MALSEDEKTVLGRLQLKVMRTERRNRLMEAYYEGEQRVEQLGLAIPPELRRFLTIVAWPGVYVDALAERVTLEGFELPDATEADEDLWRIWQANSLDRESRLAHLDALKYGQAFIVIGAGDADTPDAPSAAGGDEDRPRDAATPLITVESSSEMAVERSPRTRQPIAAAKFYVEDAVSQATLYLPTATVWLERSNAAWVEVDRDEHGLGVVPVVPLTNREQLAHRDGLDLRELRTTLDLDAGYLTRIMTRFATEGLVTQTRSTDDGRRRTATLTVADTVPLASVLIRGDIPQAYASNFD